MSGIVNKLLNNFAKPLEEKISVTRSTEICGTCGNPLEREETIQTIELVDIFKRMMELGYDQPGLYMNGNIKFTKIQSLDQEVL